MQCFLHSACLGILGKPLCGWIPMPTLLDAQQQSTVAVWQQCQTTIQGAETHPALQAKSFLAMG